MLKDINSSPQIQFPMKVEIALTAHKISLIIQSVLGGIDMKSEDRFKSQMTQFNVDQAFIFQHVHRLVRCIVDCQLHLEDSIAARNGMELARSLGAKVWDNSPLQLMQIEQIGGSTCRKLMHAGIHSVEDLEASDPYDINRYLSRNPPFGHQLLEKAAKFPKLRVSLRMMGLPVRYSTIISRHD